ncbi:50S ribosomal protein 5 alpha, chloroplastic-like [Pyrus x bretschneideri]|uniref:50S ribosomal protein 5 alpha, chloroplastic-like n=1 Tax=Pyrus x bretschneideri TaxID=225117 RepID=UPI00202DB97C|nr:50S ribosomal protein 5 alpha, chloroplastic-like [Pyrus x bretschneideri]
MGLLLYSNPLPLTTASSRSSFSSPSPTSSPSPFSATISWMHMKPNGLRPKFFSGVRLRMPVVKGSGSVVVKASSDIDGTAAANEGSEPLPDSKEEVAVPINKLPLESKLQERLEQKAKMQLAKKIRLRRNRLVRKRKLRKKGRWPPSKMKKLKNV